MHVKNKVSSIKKADEYFNADELDLLNYATSTEFADDNSIHSSISISRHSTPSINYGREDEQNRISPKRNSSPTRDRIIDQRKIITRNPAPVIPLTKKELDNRRQNLTRDISPTYIDVRRNITPVENTITILKSEQPYIVLKKNSILNVAAREKEKVAAPGSKEGKFVRTRSLTEINRIIDLCENEVGIDGMLKEIN